jgi:hypothetical protein
VPQMLVWSLLGSESVAEDVVENSVHGNQTMCCAIVVLIAGHIEWC